MIPAFVPRQDNKEASGFATGKWLANITGLLREGGKPSLVVHMYVQLFLHF